VPVVIFSSFMNWLNEFGLQSERGGSALARMPASG